MTSGESGKSGRGGDIAVYADDALDGLERAQVLLEDGELGEGAPAGLLGSPSSRSG